MTLYVLTVGHVRVSMQTHWVAELFLANPLSSLLVHLIGRYTSDVMDTTSEQRVNIKFCIRPEESSSETWNMIQQVYGGKAL